MGLRGINSVSMDAKGRFSLPTRYREQLQEQSQGRVVVTVDPVDTCLLLYPYPQYEQLEEKINAMPNQDPVVRRLQRLFTGYALELELDANGRLLLGANQRTYAELEKKLLLIGQGKKIEIWSEPVWEAWVKQKPDPQESAELKQALTL